jgi:VWFA-related protein
MKRNRDARKLLAMLTLAVLASTGAWGQRGGGRSGGGGGVQPTLGGIENAAPPLPPIYERKYEGNVKFTSRAELVLVPVVVKDKSGRPVTGLSADDFTVLENGQPQKISSFEEVKPSAARVQRPSLAPGEYSNIVASAGSPRRLTIIALDLVNTPFVDQVRAREQLIKYLAEQVDANNLTALVIINRKGVTLIQDFSADPRVLVASLQTVKGQLHLTEATTLASARTDEIIAQAAADAGLTSRLMEFATGGDFGSYRQAMAIETTLEAFQHIAQAFSAVPGRKSLLWATGSFPFTINDATGFLGGSEAYALYERTMQSLTSANIAVYPVDVRGLMAVGLPDSSVPATSLGAQLPAGGIAIAAREHANTITTLETFADMTGGKAFYNRNDLSTSFKEASDDSAAYYMLGYYLNKTNTKSGWRKLKVRVAREDVHVRARAGFFFDQSSVDPSLTRELDLAVAIQSPLDYTAVPMTVRWTQVEGKGGKKKVGFEIVLPADAATIDAGDGNRVSLEFIAQAKTGKGDSAGNFGQTFQAKLGAQQAEQIRSSGVTYHNAIEVSPGDYGVRFVVRDNVSGRMGSVLVPLSLNELGQLR